MSNNEFNKGYAKAVRDWVAPMAARLAEADARARVLKANDKKLRAPIAQCLHQVEAALASVEGMQHGASKKRSAKEIHAILHGWYRRGAERYHENHPRDKAQPDTLKGMMQVMGWVLEDNRHCLALAKTELKKHGMRLLEGKILTEKEYEEVMKC